LIYPGVEFKSVEGDALLADANFCQMRPYYCVEAVAIHTEVARRIAETNQPGRDS
jgi:hypothetical protein